MPAKILVVDDEPDLGLLIHQAFRRQIHAQEFQFVFAQNGIEALATLRLAPEIDLVLTDINMPEMDGLTLLGQLPALNPVLKAVIITTYGDMPNIRTAMQRGAYFLTKPLDLRDLEITITRTVQHVQQYLRYVARLTDAASAVEDGTFDPASLDDIVRLAESSDGWRGLFSGWHRRYPPSSNAYNNRYRNCASRSIRPGRPVRWQR